MSRVLLVNRSAAEYTDILSPRFPEPCGRFGLTALTKAMLPEDQ